MSYSRKTDIITQEDFDAVINKSQERAHRIHEFFRQQKEALGVENLEDQIKFRDIAEIINDPTSRTRYDVLRVPTNLDLETAKPPINPSPLHKNLEEEDIIPGWERCEKTNKTKVVKLNNFYIGDKILDEELVEFIKDRNIQKVLILSDNAHFRHTCYYKKIASILNELLIPFVEFTNIQPNISRQMLFKMSDYAFSHNVNAIFAVGCDSTIDLSKLLLAKLLKPNLIRLHKNKSNPVIAKNFTIASFPTFVVSDPKINSKSSFDNSIFFKKWNFLGDSIFLSHPIDNADAVFYYVPLFSELSKDKIIEVLHETYFRLILNYFDIKASDSDREKIIHNIKNICWYLNHHTEIKQLSSLDIKIILDIIASTVDGTHFIDHGFYWTWYKLESSLSRMVNSRKCDGLALFLPSFLEYAVLEENEHMRKMVISLGRSLFNTSTSDGCIYNIIKHIEKHGLPTKILDIPQIKKIDYRFFVYLLRKSTNYIGSYRMVKTIIRNLAIW